MSPQPEAPIEEIATFVSDGLLLQAILAYPAAGRTHCGIVLLSPHPCLGGDFNNNVILALAHVLAQRGAMTLRFNYRGVGESGGTIGLLERIAAFDNDALTDPQTGMDGVDALAAAQFLRAQLPETAPVHIVGYSYGATLVPPAPMFPDGRNLLVSPPVSPANLDRRPDLGVIFAENDLVVPRSDPDQWARVAGLGVQTIAGADHFFMGRTDALCERIAHWFDLPA